MSAMPFVLRADAEPVAAPAHPTILQLRIVNFVMPLLATFVTTIRLADRTRNRLLWWDDAWVAIGCVFAIMLMTSIELHLEDPSKFSQSAKIAIYYMCAHAFYLVAWTARLSILFTVIRITPPGTTRQVLMWVAISFGVMYFVLFAQLFWTCEAETSWKREALPQCVLGRNVAIAQVICDVLSDATIIVAPIRLVYRVLLSRTQKIRLTAIFSMTIVTTIVSIYHAAYVITVGGLGEILAAIVQASVSLIVANLSVVVALIFRISTEDTIHPTTLDVSVISFGRMGPAPRRRKVNGVTVTTTTFLATEFETRMQPTDNVQLDDAASFGPQESTDDKLDRLPVVAKVPSESLDTDATLVRFKVDE